MTSEVGASSTASPLPPPASMEALRIEANGLFKAGDLEGAAHLYERSAALRTSTDTAVVEPVGAARANEALKCYGNLCTVYQRLGRVSEYIRCASAAVDLQPAYAKGLAFRGKGTVLQAVARLQAALSELAELPLPALWQNAKGNAAAANDSDEDEDEEDTDGDTAGATEAAAMEREVRSALSADDGSDQPPRQDAPAMAAAGAAQRDEAKAFLAVVAHCDAALREVMDGHADVAAASLVAPNLREELAASTEQYATALGAYLASPRIAAAATAASLGATKTGDGGQQQRVQERAGTKYVTAGTGVVAGAERLPMHFPLAYLQRPVCVGYYSGNVGARLCVACGKAAATPQEVVEYARRQCPDCKGATYCSDACAAGYKVRHDMFECAPMQRMTSMVARVEQTDRELPADFVELASHTITALSAIRAGELGSGCSDSGLLLNLDHHGDEVLHTMGATVPLLCDLLAHEEQRLVQRMAGVVRCNSIQLSDRSGLGVGQAVFAGLACRFNHSCRPNAAIDADAGLIRTIRPIAPNEEITVSYMPHLYLPRNQRQEQLAERFYFTCCCTRCRTPPAADALLTGIFSEGRADANQFFRVEAVSAAEDVRCADPASVSRYHLDDLQKLLVKMQPHLLPTNHLVQEVRNAAVFAASVLGEKSVVRSLGEEEWLLWEALVPGALPVKADKLRNCLLASAGEEGGKHREATLAQLLSAYAPWSITHGEED